MHMRDGVDPDLVAADTIRKNEWEAANHTTANVQVGSDTWEQWSDFRKPDDQLHGALDGSDKPKASTGSLLFVVIRRDIKFGPRRGCELDASHERFCRRALASENTVSEDTPGASSSMRRSTSLAHPAATASGSSTSASSSRLRSNSSAASDRSSGDIFNNSSTCFFAGPTMAQAYPSGSGESTLATLGGTSGSAGAAGLVVGRRSCHSELSRPAARLTLGTSNPLERVLVLSGSDVCRCVDPVEAEYLFARAFEELDQRLAEGTLYAGLRCAAILRQMFADQHTLIARAKRGYSTKLTFSVLHPRPVDLRR
jgi:hypothetical protein